MTNEKELTAMMHDAVEAMKEVIRISDRKHDAWDKAKIAISKLESYANQSTSKPVWKLWEEVPVSELHPTDEGRWYNVISQGGIKNLYLCYDHDSDGHEDYYWKHWFESEEDAKNWNNNITDGMEEFPIHYLRPVASQVGYSELIDACNKMLTAFNDAPIEWQQTQDVMDAEIYIRTALQSLKGKDGGEGVC